MQNPASWRAESAAPTRYGAYQFEQTAPGCLIADMCKRKDQGMALGRTDKALNIGRLAGRFLGEVVWLCFRKTFVEILNGNTQDLADAI